MADGQAAARVEELQVARVDGQLGRLAVPDPALAMSRSFGGRSPTTRSPIGIVPAGISSSPAIDRSAVGFPHPTARPAP